MKTHFLLLMIVPLAGIAQTSIPPALLPVASGNVAIPLPEYNRLIEQVARAPKPVAVPPQPYVLQSAIYRLRVDRDRVSGSLELQGAVLQRGLTEVALVPGLTVLDARRVAASAGAPTVPLPLTQSAGTHTALLEGPVEFALQLDVVLALASEPGRAGFRIPPVTAGTVRLEVMVPGGEAGANLVPGIITARSPRNGSTQVEATLIPGQSSQLWWGARQSVPPAAPPERPARFLSDLKTLISVTEAELAITALGDITVLQGQPSQFELTIPAGYEVTVVTGATLTASEVSNGKVTLRVDSSARSHQFLVAMAKPTPPDHRTEVDLPQVTGAQRETGEVLVEAQGALELAAREKGAVLRRMDLRETGAPLRALAEHSPQTAFRYQRRAGSEGLALEWSRFSAAAQLAALAERAVVTTLVTREGRSLTEVRLTVRNQSRAFARVALPPGASILTADVAGEKVKPVEAPDGARVPLLRAGFRPTGPYAVSFVFSHPGAPFAKKGTSEIALPAIDLPAGAVEWELLLPSEFRVAGFGGDAVPQRWLPGSAGDAAEEPGAVFSAANVRLGPGEVGGNVIDQTGAVIPRATVLVTNALGQTIRRTTNPEGMWRAPAQPAGPVIIEVAAPGFRATRRVFQHTRTEPLAVTLTLDVGQVTETVEVSSGSARAESREAERLRREAAAANERAASVNVADLQRRLAGVLPVAVTVPRSGNAYRFVRPLVLDEPTRLTFQYRVGK